MDLIKQLTENTDSITVNRTSKPITITNTVFTSDLVPITIKDEALAKRIEIIKLDEREA